jgi:site-specific recombinase XerD
MSELPVKTGVAPTPAITDVLTSARGYAAAEKADATRRAYRSDWADFTSWCERAGVVALPASPATLAGYVAALADTGKKYSTIRRRVAAITYAHRLKRETPPDTDESVKAVLRGIRRTIGVAVERKAPATARVIASMLKRMGDDLRGKRDRALLLIGFAAALRRSELAGLDVADLEFADAGVIVHLRKSKTDQEGAGQFVAVPNGTRLRPVEALRAWLVAAAIAEGAVFRSINKGGSRIAAGRLTDRAIADVVKKRCAAAKLDPAIFSGHSLRAGFVTQALEDGADVLRVMAVTRHREVSTLQAYDRRAQAFKDHAGRKFL